MAKKSKNSKKQTKSIGSMSQPFHFGALDSKQKVVAIVAIALFIGVIGSVIPGDTTVTGQATGDGIKDLLYNSDGKSGVINIIDGAINTVFPLQVPTEKIIIYERFALFMLLFALISTGLSKLDMSGVVNMVIAGAISFISVFFMPANVLQTIGMTYSTVYASLLILVPALAIGYIAWKIPKTKAGYGAKAAIFFVLFSTFGMVKDGLATEYNLVEPTIAANVATPFFGTFSDTVILVLLLLFVYSLIRALTMSVAANAEAKREWREKELDQSFAGVIVGETQKRLKGGAQEALRNQ